MSNDNDKVCDQCGENITNQRNQRFCSQECFGKFKSKESELDKELIKKRLLKGESARSIKEDLGISNNLFEKLINEWGLQKLNKVRHAPDVSVGIQNVLDELKAANPDLDWENDVYFDAEVQDDGSLKLKFYDVRWSKEE